VKELTPAQAQQAIDKLDEMCEIIGSPPISHIYDDLRKQMPEINKDAFWQTMQDMLNATLVSAISQMSDEFIAMLNNPIKQQEFIRRMTKDGNT
jgi:hypothetical protein